MLQKNDEIELQVEKLALAGKAVAHHNGLVCFVRKGVPGDVVRAGIIKVKKNYLEAETVEILTPSRDRVQPKCKYFGTCGGCEWQNLGYTAQLREKQQRVVDAFERIGGFSNIPVLPIIGCEKEYFYRNKMEFSFSRERWLTKEEIDSGKDIPHSFGLGLHTPGRFDKVLDIDECWLQSELSNGILNAVRDLCRTKQLTVYSTKTHEGYLRHLVIRQSIRTAELMVNLVTTTDEPKTMQVLTSTLLNKFPSITTIVNNITTRKSMVAFGEQENVYHGPGYITEKLGSRTFRISSNSFFQTNTLQAERLYAVVKQMGELAPSDIVFDLYCGTGTIALFIADAVRKVIGVDVVESAIEDARQNAGLNDVHNCEFIVGDLKDTLTKDTGWLTEKPDVIIFDPPRSGLHPKVVEQVAFLNPERIVYVSCNPSTQARDAKMFSELGYQLLELQPVDMFPHTSHVENVAAFRRL